MKTITKKIISGLGILSLLAVGITFVPANANAEYGWLYSQDYNYPQNSFQEQSYYQRPVQAPVYAEPYVAPKASTIAQTIYSSSTNPNQTNNTTSTKKVAVAKKTTATSADSKDSYNGLAANAIFGDSNSPTSFMPSGLIQWIIFAILILFVVILVRKVSGSGKNYHKSPMKHA